MKPELQIWDMLPVSRPIMGGVYEAIGIGNDLTLTQYRRVGEYADDLLVARGAGVVPDLNDTCRWIDTPEDIGAAT